jgi:hypothetical protein
VSIQHRSRRSSGFRRAEAFGVVSTFDKHAPKRTRAELESAQVQITRTNSIGMNKRGDHTHTILYVTDLS